MTHSHLSHHLPVPLTPPQSKLLSPDSSPISSQFLTSTMHAPSITANSSPPASLLPSLPICRMPPTLSFLCSVSSPPSMSPSQLHKLTLPQPSSLAAMSPHTAKVTNKTRSKKEQEYFSKTN